MDTMLFQKILEFRATFRHNIEQISRYGLPVAKCEEPDFAADRSWNALVPEMSQVMLVLVVVPRGENFPLPSRYRLLKPSLLLKPKRSFLFNLFLNVPFAFEVADSIFTGSPVSLIQCHGVLLSKHIKFLLSHAQVFGAAGEYDVLNHGCEFILLHSGLMDVLLIDHI